MTRIIGHRGAADLAVENTLESFRAAIEAGCDRAELDVRLTADNQAVVMHDKTIDRTTNGTGLVRTYTLAELRAFRCHNGEPVPTLQEVIDVCRGKVALQIEIKEAGTPAVVYRQIVDNDLRSSVVVSSFHHELLTEIHQLDDSLKLLFLFKDTPTDFEALGSNSLVYAVGLSADRVTPECVARAHECGLVVYAYRVDTREVGQQLTAWGVDELSTNNPQLFVGA